MATTEDQDQLNIEEFSTNPPLIPLIVSLFLVDGRFRKKRK